MKKIVSIKKFTSKKGQPLCLVTCVTEFSDYEQSNMSCFGASYITYFVQADNFDMFNQSAIGKELKGFFGFGNNINYVQSPDIV